jgi:hypothetical protein
MCLPVVISTFRRHLAASRRRRRRKAPCCLLVSRHGSGAIVPRFPFYAFNTLFRDNRNHDQSGNPPSTSFGTINTYGTKRVILGADKWRKVSK